MQAEVVKSFIQIDRIEGRDEILVINGSENIYQDYKNSPDLISFKNRLYKKTGFNSDRLEIYYKPAENTDYASIVTPTNIT